MNPTALVAPAVASAALVPAISRLVAAFLAGRNPRTIAAYRADLADFRTFTGDATPEDAARRLIEHGHGAANGLVLEYRAHLLERTLAPATVNRRIAALRSLVKLARSIGAVAWALEVPSVKSAPYRDTKGPGADGVHVLLGLLAKRTDAKGRRDYACVRLMYDRGLRRGEVVGLSLEHFDAKAGTVSILGKGRTERETLTLADPTTAALVAWLELRGSVDGPLFLNFDRAGKGAALTGRSLHRLLKPYGVHPHGLRHAAITAALDLSNGDVRRVQRFSRHRDVRVLSVYDDNRQDIAGEVTRLVAAAV